MNRDMKRTGLETIKRKYGNNQESGGGQEQRQSIIRMLGPEQGQNINLVTMFKVLDHDPYNSQ